MKRFTRKSDDIHKNFIIDVKCRRCGHRAEISKAMHETEIEIKCTNPKCKHIFYTETL